MEQTEQQSPGYGQFGNLADAYGAGRQGYPKWVLDFLASFLPKRCGGRRLLDAGCGTGISTRQLAERGYQVIGVDHDPAMITRAMPAPNTSYIPSKFVDLGLNPKSFDGVTAFSSFHWFRDDDAAVGALVKLLRPGGCFLVANKTVTKEVAYEYRDVIARWSRQPVPNIKENYDPREVLRKFNLLPVERHEVEREQYTEEGALALLKSKSLWNLVPDANKHLAERELKHILAANVGADDEVIRIVNIDVYIGVLQ